MLETQQPVSSPSHTPPIRMEESLGVDKVPESMRTITRVDMARKESNTTDENSATELVDVQIPPPPAKPKATPEQPGPRPRLSEDIHRYFQPTGRKEFDIACDDTATTNELSESDGLLQPARPDPTNRPPLQSLNDSEVNRLQGELESVSEFSDVEPEILQPYHEPRGDPDASFARRGQSVIGRDELLERIGRLSPPSPSNPFTSNTTVENLSSSPRPNEHALLPTPPSSDPRGGRSYNPPFRPHGRQNAVVARQRQTQRSNIPGRGVAVADRLAQTTLPAIAERFRKRGEIDFDSDSESSIGGDIPQLSVLDSESTSLKDRIRGIENPYELPSEGTRARPSTSTSRRSSTEGPDGDPRRYLIRRQRSRAIHGHPRRMSSRRLPLETISGDRETHDISGTIHFPCSDVQTRMGQLATMDPYIRDGSLAAALPFRDMTEVQLVEDRLKLQVGLWMAKENMKVEDVVYRLQSEAKGKGRG